MDDSYIIGKMNSFMHILSDHLCSWLYRKLPALSDDWWDELVYDNLSYLQQQQITNNNILELRELDLAALLRVFYRNWYIITSKYYIKDEVRSSVKEMMEVRNEWAHITSSRITKDKVENDVNLIIDLIHTFDGKLKDTRELSRFLIDIEDDNELKQYEEKDESSDIDNINVSDKSIKNNSIVSLVSNPNKVGPVIQVKGDVYTVWIDNQAKTYYREQIKPVDNEEDNKGISIDKLRVALTAYQIDNPNANNLYSLNAARIDFVPYQFRPALKIIKSRTPRILIADDVGVGKTIEAGLILKELEARSDIESVLIICPKPLVAERKWELEMKRFDEQFTQLDGQELAECISETNRDGVWPDRHKKTIIPYSLFNEDSLNGTDSQTNRKHKNKGLLQLDPFPHFDLVIVDEAHNIRNSNTWAYRGVEILTRYAGAVVFLTATPMQNSNNDLYTLLNLLRPDEVIDKETFDIMSEPNVYVNSLMKRIRYQKDEWQEEAKDDIQNILSTNWGRNVIQHNPSFEKVYKMVQKGVLTNEERVELIPLIENLHSFNEFLTRTRRKDIEDICYRHSQTIKVSFSKKQKEIYDALMEFEEKTLRQIHGNNSVKFMMCTIMRQASSCLYGLEPFLNEIINRRLNQINEDGELYDYSFNFNQEDSIYDLADKLEKLIGNLPEEDPKITRLYEIIDAKQKEVNNKLILFSSFRHTLNYIRTHLEDKGYRVAQVDGSVEDEERFKIRERFILDKDDDNAIDILLFSEVGCEGLDYQFCDTMINYDLPWNPMRIEQRIGRIDRRGQKSEFVRVFNMITEDTIDAVVYDRCLWKIGVFENSLGDCSEILGDIGEQIFKIMLDSELSNEERKLKIEKMAENELLKINEMKQLEENEKSLYGFDLSEFTHKKDVQDAANDWITPDSMNDLVNAFLYEFLGGKNYVQTNKKEGTKVLRLGLEDKKTLLDDLNALNITDINNASRIWRMYLKNKPSRLAITYDPNIAKDDRKTTFLTQLHPLVVQAAKHMEFKLPCKIAFRINDSSIPSGDYEFVIFAWRYVGISSSIKLKVIGNSEYIGENVLNYLQYGTEYNCDLKKYEDNWSLIERKHYGIWQIAKKEYLDIVKDECNYRIEQNRESNRKRKLFLDGQIKKLTDDKILRMRKSQLDSLESSLIEKEKEYEDTINKADIHFQALVNGVLHVD